LESGNAGERDYSIVKIPDFERPAKDALVDLCDQVVYRSVMIAFKLRAEFRLRRRRGIERAFAPRLNHDLTS